MNVVLLDIGSGSVGLSLVELKKNDVPIINFVAREEFNLGEVMDIGRIIPLTFLAIEKLKDKMDRVTSVRPSEVHCFFASHLVMSQASTGRAVFDQPEVITEEIIHDIVRGGLNYSVLAPDMEKIEEKIMQVRLNGYETAEPLGHLAREVEVASFVSLVEKDFLKEFKFLLQSVFPGQPASYHSFALTSYGVIREILGDASDEFLCIDVGSEITEVGISRNGSLEKTVSFPHGKSSFMRNLLGTTGGMFPHVNSEINIWGRGHSHEDSNREDNILRAGEAWRNNFGSEVFARAAGLPRCKAGLPQKIFIISDEDVAPVYYRLMQNAKVPELSQYIPEIKSMAPVLLRDFVKNKSGTRDDSFLMMEAMFINKIVKN